MPDIVTLTMNPALDISTSTASVHPTNKLRCAEPRYDPGGGGINVARVIHRLGGAVLAIFPAGGPPGLALEELLIRSGVPHRCIPVDGITRENFAVDDQRTGQQYRFILPGPKLTEADQQRCLARLADAASGARFLVVSGSLPPGVPTDFYLRVARTAERIGTRLVLDTSGTALRQRYGAYLVKPSLRELQDCVGRELRTEIEQVAAARELIGAGVSDVVIVSLGARGALAVSADGSELHPPIDVPIRSACGAGDSMVAGVTLALTQGMSLQDAVRRGNAAGAATVMAPGTELCHAEEVDRLYRTLVEAGPGTTVPDVGSG